MHLPLLISLLVLFSATALHAEEKKVYKQTADDGVVEFSDQPGTSSSPVTIPKMNTYKQKPIKNIYAKPRKLQEAEGYKTLTIIAPTNDSIVRANDGNVSITLALKPALKPSHSIRVSIDNSSKTSLTGKTMRFNFKNLSRGTHKAIASVLDNENKALISSRTIEFHLQRVAIKPAAPSGP